MGLKIKKGDTVMVIAGRYGDTVGRVLAVFPKKGKALVEGVNMVKRHTRPTSKRAQGGIIEREAAIELSNLMLVDPKTGIASRFRNRTDEKGNKVRVLVKSGNEV